MAQYDSSRSMPMTSAHKELLRRHLVTLMENLDTRMLLPHLVSSEVITHSSMQQIQRGHASDSDKAFELLQILQKRPDSCYYEFIEALKKTGQSHLAGLLEDTGRAVQVSQGTSLTRGIVTQVYDMSLGPGEIAACPFEFYRQHKDESYDMAGKNKGRVLIINVTEIKEGNEVTTRPGARKDAQTLDELFHKLGFTVDMKNNPSVEDMDDTVQTFATSRSNAKAKSIFVIIMSHGGKRSNSPFIFTADGAKWDYMSNLEKKFNAKNAPLLVSKPKVFITQACMGANLDKGVEYDGATGRDKPEIAGSRRATFSDYLFAFATRPGYMAERDREEGSIFLQEINRVFREFSATKHVTDMLTKVRSNVEAKTQGQGFVQTPHEVNTLKQPFYLFPGI